MIDILTIRDALNALRFKDGKRRVLIGRISDHFAPEIETADDDQMEEEIEHEQLDSPQIIEYIHSIQRELDTHGLILERDGAYGDELYAVQGLRTSAGNDWIAEGVKWASQITTIALEMVVPGIIGSWLDRKLGVSFLTLSGFLLGLAIGIWHLLQLTRSAKKDSN